MNDKEQAVAELMSLFKKFSTSFRAQLRIKLKENSIDLTTEMVSVLRVLFEKDGIIQQEIAHAIVKDKASITYLIDNLTKRNYVKRVEDENDRRNNLIFLTKEGKDLKRRINGWYKEIFNKASAHTQIEEIKNVVPVFDKLILSLEVKV